MILIRLIRFINEITNPRGQHAYYVGIYTCTTDSVEVEDGLYIQEKIVYVLIDGLNGNRHSEEFKKKINI